MPNIQDEHVIKCRDDQKPIYFLKKNADNEDQFEIKEGAYASWVKETDSFGVKMLRSRVEPWLTALFQSEHFTVLVGSGLTQAVHQMATGDPLPVMNNKHFAVFNEEITKEAKLTAKLAGREEGNIEDQIRVANELLRGIEIIASSKGEKTEEAKRASQLKESLEKILGEFASSILKGESGLALAKAKEQKTAFTYLISFLMSFASRTGTRDRLQLFTTNYDRYIEAGADLAGLRLIDRFVGTLAPVFRSSRLDVDMHYNPPGIRGEPRYLEGVAHFTKLHGSVDWVDCNKTIRRIGLPLGARDITPYLDAPGLDCADPLQLMVYPNASKDRETTLFPYVELFRDFASATCRPNSTLVCYGYSFGDEHINRVIEDMLTIPSAHLVVISFNDPLGRIMEIYRKVGRPAQITLLLGRHFGDLRNLVDHYLPKPAIDRTTIRMAELLKARWGGNQDDQHTKADQPLVQGDEIS